MIKQQTGRQGDVLYHPIKSLPKGCVAVPLNAGRIVLAYGEVTGHAHAIDLRHLSDRADEIAQAAIARARLWQAPNGDRYLEVKEPLALSHEEHSTHLLAPGIYELPIQVAHDVEHGPRQVAD